MRGAIMGMSKHSCKFANAYFLVDFFSNEKDALGNNVDELINNVKSHDTLCRYLTLLLLLLTIYLK